jgi:hypothetical protein
MAVSFAATKKRKLARNLPSDAAAVAQAPVPAAASVLLCFAECLMLLLALLQLPPLS